MKKFLMVPLLLIVLSITGFCGQMPPEKNRIIVVTSILPLSEFTEKVGQDKVEVMTMVPPGADPHSYEPKPSQLRELSKAKLYVKVGSGIEFELNWMKKLANLNKQMRICNASKKIKRIPKDPHTWVSVINAIYMVNSIRDSLAAIDPPNRYYYRKNAAQYIRQLQQLNFDIYVMFRSKNERSFLCLHPSWGYFARDYKLDQEAIEAEGKEPKAADLSKLIETAKKENRRVIFASPQFSTRSAEVISKQIGANIVLIDPLAKDFIPNMKKVGEELSNSLK